MKIAVFGDIHGNIEALKTTYEVALSNNVQQMYHLGDLGGYAPFVNEVVDFLVAHGIPGVQGNYDYNVAHQSEHCGCKYEDPLQADLADKSFSWTKQHALYRSVEYMRRLPMNISLSIEGRKVLLFHAAPHKNSLYWYEDRSDKFFIQMLKKTNADILVYGHTHVPYRKEIAGKVFINAGSVGKPKDGDPRACLTILEITHNSVQHEFLKVPYGVEKVASAIRSSGLPSELADKLLLGQ